MGVPFDLIVLCHTSRAFSFFYSPIVAFISLPFLLASIRAVALFHVLPVAHNYIPPRRYCLAHITAVTSPRLGSAMVIMTPHVYNDINKYRICLQAVLLTGSSVFPYRCACSPVMNTTFAFAPYIKKSQDFMLNFHQILHFEN